MNPADKRLQALLDKWLASLDEHLKYVDLGDTEYAALKAWPTHDRPTRWIVELARQKTLELKSQHEARMAMGDGRFAEALELMGFLANLVGAEHVKRFIPLVTAEGARGDVRKEGAAGVTEATREMPGPATRLRTMASASTAAPPSTAESNPAQARTTRRTVPPVSPAPAAPAEAPAKVPTGTGMQKKVIADAVRLLKWGRQWHELVELIDRIVDRPPAAEIRRILRSHRTEIEKLARQGR